MKRQLAYILLMACSIQTHAASHDSLRHTGYTFTLSPGTIVVMDSWQRKWQKKKNTCSAALELNWQPLPEDSSTFARDYNYPTFSFGVKFSRNDVTMHRSPDEAWGLAEEVDYDSRLGNITTAYGTFSRPVLRTAKWTAAYMLGTGIGYGVHKYSKGNNIDNELTGSRFLIYFTAGLHATYHIAQDWGLTAGVEFYHHSNGALNRPNKGANIIGPTVGVRYMPYQKHMKTAQDCGTTKPYSPHFFTNFAVGLGGKTLNEDWQLTQFQTHPDSARYRTSRFHFYPAYSLQADLMYRYARRWASGIGADLFYGTYASRVREIEPAESGRKISKWSAGLAAKHNVYYHNLSVRMSIGYYLFRRMGTNANDIEKPFYERIGLHYSFPKLGGATIGANVKAHMTKADFTEVVISFPILL